MKFPGVLYLCILLPPVLEIKAQPVITKTDSSAPYGIISETTALTCTDSAYDPATSSAFIFLKSGANILSQVGEISTSGKYSATTSAGSIQMTIQDVVISDEDSYTCSINFQASPAYDLEVEVKPTNDTTATLGLCTGPGNDYSGDKLTFTCTDLYPSPSAVSVMDGTQTVVGTPNIINKTNSMFDLEWTATASSSPKTYILTVAITTRSAYTLTVKNTIKVTTTTPHPVCDCCCCDNKPKRDGACGAVLAVCICVMAALGFCGYTGFSSKNLQGKIVLSLAIIFFIVALTGFILSAICLSKECCSCSGDSCQVKNCFKGDTIAAFVMTGIGLLGTPLVVILIFMNSGNPGSGKQKTEAENEELKGNKR